MKKGFIGEILLVVAGLFTVVIFMAFGYLFIKSVNGVGYVSQNGNGTGVKEFIKEEDDCVYFIDVLGNSVKTCGIYQIIKTK